ncbi:hypothetical protein T07_8563 [Trichinella nelsoni]|uniref:Uncharacterized protein n=1 Tax=Trichinella nelsoni TaxID=6336 RepID=A0A0V0S3W1_9BILA|nr:hypothetical protein T07_8563 [Trichinella nelsoni]
MTSSHSPDMVVQFYKMLQTEEMQHLELDDAYRCNWGIWFNIFRLMRTEDIMRLAYASREINAMAQSYFKKGLEKRSLFGTKKKTIDLSLVSKCAE